MKKLLFASLLLISFSSVGQNIRGFYLCDLGNFLGNAAKEDAILQYAQGNGFNYITFYDLGDVNWSSTTNKNQLGAFISKGRTQYGITQFGAVVETYAYVTSNILPFNNSRASANEKFDVINLEFEFWVTASINSSYCSKFLAPAGYSCDTAGAWKFAWKQFRLIDSLCAANGLISEVYLGWPNQGQMQQLASIADRILLHAYRPNDADVYAYSKNRLKDIATLNTSKKIIPLFSSENAFMGPWLATHPVTRPYQTYASDLAAETGSFKQYINLQGYHWFTYTYLPKTVLASASISASGPLSFCSGGSVTLTANSGASYLWQPGGQTSQSITVSAAGSYTVRVTNASGVSATSSPAVVSISSSGTTPTVSVSGPLSFCPGGSVTLTSSSASSYLWSNGATTQSITVSNSGNYTVTTGSGSCTATSAAVNVNAAAGPSTPTISASGTLNLCPGANVTLTSSTANGYLWSNGETTRSIVVSSPGTYFVKGYSGPNCFAQSANTTITSLSAPATPTVTLGGSATLSPTQPSVDLTSSAANAYLWSTNETARTITVTAAGNYAVTVTGSNGCKATSSPTPITYNSCSPPPVPAISLSASPVIYPGQAVILTSTTSNGYLWSTGETTRSITVTSPGSYWVRVFSGGNCYSNSVPVNITYYTGTGTPIQPAIDKGVQTDTENLSGIEFSVFPNPGRGTINFSFVGQSEEKLTLQLLDLTGRELLRNELQVVTGENLVISDVSALPRGIYLAMLSGDRQKQIVKLILE